jgi:hypothetical protein
MGVTIIISRYNAICKELLDRLCTKTKENIDRLTWLLVLPHERIVKKKVELFKEKNTTIIKIIKKQTPFSGGQAREAKKKGRNDSQLEALEQTLMRRARMESHNPVLLLRKIMYAKISGRTLHDDVCMMMSGQKNR